MVNPHIEEEDELLETFVEKYVPTPVILDYVFRKFLLGVLVVNLFVVRQLSKVYGFNFESELEDRDSWKWNVKEKIPLYRPFFEKVN